MLGERGGRVRSKVQANLQSISYHVVICGKFCIVWVSEDRGQGTEDRGQRTEDGGQRAGDRFQGTGARCQNPVTWHL